MKNKQKIEFTLGDLITATYQVWGEDQAEKMVRFAIASRLAVLREQPHLLISSTKWRSL
jgi:hypothetical protein